MPKDFRLQRNDVIHGNREILLHREESVPDVGIDRNARDTFSPSGYITRRYWKRERRRHRGVIFQERNDRGAGQLGSVRESERRFLVAATANKESQLAKLCDMHVTIPAPGELQPFEKGSSSVGTSESRVSPPVTYTALQMMFGDTCAVYIMQARGLTQDEYAMNHPAGRIGKRLVLRVQDVMRKIESLPTVSPEEKGLEVLVKMAGDTKGCGCLLVVDKDMTLLGTFSDGDLRRATVAKGAEVSNLLVKDLMNYNKAFPRCCEAEQMAYEAQMNMNLNGKMVDYLPVISGDGKKTLLGLITIESLSEAGM